MERRGLFGGHSLIRVAGCPESRLSGWLVFCFETAAAVVAAAVCKKKEVLQHPSTLAPPALPYLRPLLTGIGSVLCGSRHSKSSRV